MITVIAEIKVKPGHRATVLLAIEKLVPLVLAEEGCGEYTPMVDSNTQAPWQKRSPDSVFMLEKWESMAHLENIWPLSTCSNTATPSKTACWTPRSTSWKTPCKLRLITSARRCAR